MKKFLLPLILALLSGNAPAIACDACGCSVNGVGVGLMAVYRQSYAGLQYQYIPFRSSLEHSLGAADYFHSLELVARVQPLPHVNLQFNLPYRFNIRRNPAGDATRSGPGDARVVVHYAFLNRMPANGGWRIYAEAGVGVKAPTGRFDPDIHDVHNLPENFNPGNGSWAGLLQANVVAGHNNGGLALSGSYQHNRPSASGYRFGHQWSGQALLYHQFLPNGKVSLTPYGGLSAEGIGRDEKAGGKYAASTGGEGWFGAGGINLRLGRWLAGASFSLPLSQHYSNAEVEAKSRLTLQLSHIF